MSLGLQSGLGIIANIMDIKFESSTRITDLLQAWSEGQDESSNELADRVYRELHLIATAYLRSEHHLDLEPSELVHEAWLKLSDCHGVFPSRRHFYAFAALQMRRLLIDYARSANADARFGEKITLSLGLTDPGARPAELVILADALDQLDRLDPRKSHTFTLTQLAGFDNQQVAEMLDVSAATVERDLRFARVWLAARMA